MNLEELQKSLPRGCLVHGTIHDAVVIVGPPNMLKAVKKAIPDASFFYPSVRGTGRLRKAPKAAES